MIPITLENYRKVLGEVVEDFGSDYQYVREQDHTGCLYVHDRGSSQERAGCLHGQVLIRMGYDIPDDYEHRSIGDVLGELFGVTDYELITAALSCQSAQDVGTSWGVALEMFDHEVRPRPGEWT